MWAAGRKLVDLFTRHRRQKGSEFRSQRILDLVVILVRIGRSNSGGGDCRRQMYFPDGRHKGDNLNAMGLLQVLLCNGSCSNPA
jgi:hypothetical protein